MFVAASVFLFLSYSLLGQADRPIAKSLYLDNGINAGHFGDTEFCTNGSFVTDVEISYEDHHLVDDRTAVNTVKLYCATPEGHHTNYITSTVGDKGTWRGMHSCDQGLMTGMRGKVMPNKGVIGDDEAVQNIEMECDYGKAPSVLAFPSLNDTDNWGSWASCNRGTAICGIQVRYEGPQPIDDDVAVADVVMHCCLL